MNNQSPIVSVLLPVYNCELYIGEAIESILKQTFEDFELIIINDASNDNTDTIIKNFLSDPRVRYYKNEENLQLIRTLNKGLNYCNGKYIARMDADDIALPSRLQEQVSFLDNETDYVLVGCEYKTFGQKLRVIRLPHSDFDCRSALLTCSPFCHPGVMFRRTTIEENKIRYNDSYQHVEDYKFFFDLSRFGKVANLNSILLYYRIHSNQITMNFSNEQMQKRFILIDEINGGIEQSFEYLLLKNERDNKITKYFLKGYLEVISYFKVRCTYKMLKIILSKGRVVDILKFAIRKISK
ncbi:TPA: glycosyltransferase family 2 protein [Citrobacter freundii]